MIITVASGKGGTGKTTVATNLAVSLDQPVQLLDCDVEEPNSHIFLKPERLERERVHTMIPAVDTSKCTYCGACDEICQFSAITVVGKSILTFPEMCHSCMGCVMVCPENAVSASSRELGEMIKGQAGRVELIYGQLRVGEAMSPPLIAKVKENIDPQKVNIIDAPPGTSCPVIEAVKASDFVVMVTEPTPFGLNDLKLAVEAVRLMKIPFGIVINRFDTGNDDTRMYAEQEKIPILMEIPDKREIAEAYSQGCMITEIMPEMKAAFQALYQKIKTYADEQ